ncbi:hypothetical protein ACFLR5_00700 [Elusimicrobiota bacterium]
MKRKLGNYFVYSIILVLSFTKFQLFAANYNTYTWTDEQVHLAVTESYGDAGSNRVDEIQSKAKAYNLFNILHSHNQKVSVHINNTDMQTFPSTDDTLKINKLDYTLLMEKMDISIDSPERYSPFIYENSMHNLLWASGKQELEVDSISVFQSDEYFELVGRQNENLLIKVDGKLIYLDEVTWTPVANLKSYNTNNIKWVDENTISAYTERGGDKKKNIVISSIRKPDIVFLTLPPGKYLDHSVTGDMADIYCLTDKDGRNGIFKYSKNSNSWEIIESTSTSLKLLGEKQRVFYWWNTQTRQIFSSNGKTIDGFTSKSITTYPYGKYVNFSLQGLNIPVPGSVLEVLFYKRSIAGKMKELGFKQHEIFEGDNPIWLLRESYSHQFDRFSDKVGNLFLMETDKKLRVYYDVLNSKHLRRIKSMVLVPAVSGIMIIYGLGVLLLLLMAYEIAIKLRRFLK